MLNFSNKNFLIFFLNLNLVSLNCVSENNFTKSHKNILNLFKKIKFQPTLNTQNYVSFYLSESYHIQNLQFSNQFSSLYYLSNFDFYNFDYLRQTKKIKNKYINSTIIYSDKRFLNKKDYVDYNNLPSYYSYVHHKNNTFDLLDDEATPGSEIFWNISYLSSNDYETRMELLIPEDAYLDYSDLFSIAFDNLDNLKLKRCLSLPKIIDLNNVFETEGETYFLFDIIIFH